MLNWFTNHISGEIQYKLCVQNRAQLILTFDLYSPVRKPTDLHLWRMLQLTFKNPAQFFSKCDKFGIKSTHFAFFQSALISTTLTNFEKNRKQILHDSLYFSWLKFLYININFENESISTNMLLTILMLG